MDRLSKLSGPEFDRQYIRTMIEDHKEDLKAFQRDADKGQDQRALCHDEDAAANWRCCSARRWW